MKYMQTTSYTIKEDFLKNLFTKNSFFTNFQNDVPLKQRCSGNENSMKSLEKERRLC